MGRDNNKKGLIVLVVVLFLVVFGLVAYIIFGTNNKSNYTYENLEGYYEIVDENNPDNVVYKLLLFKDGYFQIEETTPYSMTLGNYLIEDDKLILNYQLVLGGGYPMSIHSLSETRELTINSLNKLIGSDGEYVRNESLEDSKLVKVSFDGNRDYIATIAED